ncbi:hypothetical protein RhoBH5_31195, partial [Rhodococcus sp. BH5]|nr:hypothetical protein [Rhodococcus sp. BH5]
MSPLGLTIGGIVATVAAAIIGYLGSRLARASAKEANTTTSWAELFKANEAQFARMDTRITHQDDRISRLEADLR